MKEKKVQIAYSQNNDSMIFSFCLINRTICFMKMKHDVCRTETTSYYVVSRNKIFNRATWNKYFL